MTTYLENTDQFIGTPQDRRVKTARKLKAQFKANLEFFKERLKIQSDPNYNPFKIIRGWNMGSRAEIKERQYSELDIKLEQIKIDKCNKVIESNGEVLVNISDPKHF